MAKLKRIPGYLTLRQAAVMIGVSHAQASRYVANKRLDYVKMGCQYLIPEAAVLDFERPYHGNPAFSTNQNPAILAAKKKKKKSS